MAVEAVFLACNLSLKYLLVLAALLCARPQLQALVPNGLPTGQRVLTEPGRVLEEQAPEVLPASQAKYSAAQVPATTPCRWRLAEHAQIQRSLAADTKIWDREPYALRTALTPMACLH